MPIGAGFLSDGGQDGPHTYDEALTVGESRPIEVNTPVGRVHVRSLEPRDRNMPETRFLSQPVGKRQEARDAKRKSTKQTMKPLVEEDIHAHDLSFSILGVSLACKHEQTFRAITCKHD